MYPSDFFFRAAQRYPEHIAIESRASAISYGELARKVNAVAYALQQMDPRPGSAVGLCAANSDNYIIAMLAILAAGKVWVPLNYRSTQAEIQRITATIDPGIVIMDELGAALATDTKHYKRLHTQDMSALADKYATCMPAEMTFPGEQTQAIKFTGGTTGVPKGVMQPYRAWNTVIMNQIHGWEITKDDKFVVCAPISHGTGTYVLPLLAQGGCLLLAASSDPQDIAHAFEKQGGTMSFMPPTLIYKLMTAAGITPDRFPALRLLIYGGAGMPAEKIMHVQQFFGPVLATTYGQTEAPQIATLMKPEDLSRPEYRQSVGKATWLTDIAIMDANGKKLGCNETGEIAIRGDLVMTGYWQLPEKTAETIKYGWLHTGDVGQIDEHGFVYIKDRIRDVIITGGFNVYPIDVENILSQHPAVYEVAVFGTPDEKWGEAVNAAIQLRPSASASETELKQFVRERLGPVQTPKAIHFLDNLPRSAVGKILKKNLQEHVSRQLSPSIVNPS